HEQPDAAEHEPCLIAVPVRCNRVRHLVPLALAAGEWKHDPGAEIEAVEDDVHGDGDADDAGPDQRKIPFHGHAPFSPCGTRRARLPVRQTAACCPGSAAPLWA